MQALKPFIQLIRISSTAKGYNQRVEESELELYSNITFELKTCSNAHEIWGTKNGGILVSRLASRVRMG